MRKIIFLLTFFVAGVLSAQNVADTTFVTTPQVQLDWYGDFDATVQFPDGDQTYRQIIMTLKLGQYNCPPGDQYCHQWDYNAHIQLLVDGEVYELGRFITPFATAGWSRFGVDWEQPYIFDVSDYYPLLKGEKEVRIFYSGYSGGFTAELEFAFIEGTPEREVLDIKSVYHLSKTYGNPEEPFNDHLGVFSDTTPEGTQDALLKVLVTGHGSDNTEQCCEFSSHYYDVILNNGEIDRFDIWRDDCGENDLYPQGGTWIYNRSNWCPGAKVEPVFHHLNLSSEEEFDLQVQFEDYVGSGDLGSYFYHATLFYYGETYKETDAAVMDIVAPTDDPNHFRANPSGNIPVIKVKNTGSENITTMDFSYGIQAYGSQETYTWTGMLAPQEQTEISLAPLNSLTDLSLEEAEGTYHFEVEITSVNGEEDDDLTNNMRTSSFVAAPTWPAKILVDLKTGSKVANGYIFNNGASDISWEITDMEGNIIHERNGMLVKTDYLDEVEFEEAGFYKFTIRNSNCFGLFWWPYGSATTYTPGFLKIKTEDGTLIPMNNYKYTGTAHDDWGCVYTQYFSTDAVMSVDQQSLVELMVYPNPAKELLNVRLKGSLTAPYEVNLVDIQGRTVYRAQLNEEELQIPVQQLNKGLYMLVLKDANQTKYIEKVIIGN